MTQAHWAILLPGLPRLVDADYQSHGDDIRILLDLEQYNHEATANYLLFQEQGIFGPQVTAYIAEIPQSLDLKIDANLTINATAENLTLAGSIDFESNQRVGPIYIHIELDGEQPYSLEILLPQLPSGCGHLDAEGLLRLALFFLRFLPIKSLVHACLLRPK